MLPIEWLDAPVLAKLSQAVESLPSGDAQDALSSLCDSITDAG